MLGAGPLSLCGAQVRCLLPFGPERNRKSHHTGDPVIPREHRAFIALLISELGPPFWLPGRAGLVDTVIGNADGRVGNTHGMELKRCAGPVSFSQGREAGRRDQSDEFDQARIGLGFLPIKINKRPGNFCPFAFNFGKAIDGRAARVDLGLDNVDKLVIFGVSRFGEGSLPGQSSLVSEKSDEFGAQGRITGIANRLGLC